MVSKSKDTNCNTDEQTKLCCSLPIIQERDLSHIADGNRSRLISLISNMWVNGTELTYFFFRDNTQWRGESKQEQAVREGFDSWKQLGIGLNFREVDNAADAIVKIGFDNTDGSWSYIGRDCIKYASSPSDRTTNFGWDLTTPYGRDTVLHEIGHVLGFPHEHQNPLAGIIWNDERVYANLGGPPNNWSREETFWNIIRKIPPNTVDGSDWDKNSIMHYQFEAGLINEPSEYRSKPLIPESGLSKVDIETVTKLYPPLKDSMPELLAFESQRININAGEQIDFVINSSLTREYTIQTFGEMDTVMVLFEVRDGVEEYMDGNDDSGENFNSKISSRLHRGREYILRLRLYFTRSYGNGSVMLY